MSDLPYRLREAAKFAELRTERLLFEEAADRIELLESIADPLGQEAYARVREAVRELAKERERIECMMSAGVKGP